VRYSVDHAMKSISFNVLQSLAASVGLSVVAVADAEPLSEDMAYLQRWQEAGYAGEMSYMLRPADLLGSPKQLEQAARTVVVIGAFYDRSEREQLKPGFGRVARYAWGRDYHKVLRKRLQLLVEEVQRALGIVPVFRLFSDSVPLLERAVASKAGLGFVGKNTLVIVPRAGSFMFLGEVLWDLEVTELPRVTPKHVGGTRFGKSHCGSCTQCLSGCPTEAFVEPYVLDARRCISYLTIEKRGELTLEERAWIGEWLFGCDVCQEVCPFNAISIKGRKGPQIPEFEASQGVGQMVSLVETLGIRTDDEFAARFAGTPVMRAKREGLVRNAAVVAANTRYAPSVEALRAAVLEDSSPIVRQHALWAYCHLSTLEGGVARRISEQLVARALDDPEISVRREAERCRAMV
jgi:epoxyqueuosine reductase